jgi:hypothetical protein
MISTLVIPAALAFTISISSPAPSLSEGDVQRERTAPPVQMAQDPRGRHGPFYTWHTANQRAEFFRGYGFSANVWGRQGEWWVDVW